MTDLPAGLKPALTPTYKQADVPTAPSGLTHGTTVRVIAPGSGGDTDLHHPTDRVVIDHVGETGALVHVYDRTGRRVGSETYTYTSVRLVPVEQPALPVGATLDELLAHQARNPATPLPRPTQVITSRYTEALRAVADLVDACDHHANGLEVQLERARQIAAALEQENARILALARDVVDGKVGALSQLWTFVNDKRLADEQGHGGERVERP